MDLGIKGKSAWVTASSKGLGFAVARRLSMEGARVAVCARDEAALFGAAESIRKETGGEVFHAACDVSREAEIERFHERAAAALGPADILVVNAGGPPPGTFESVRPEQWNAGFDLNFLSGVHLIRRVLPGMKERNWGRVLCMTSISAKMPLANMVISNAIRAGVIGMAKTLSDEVAGYNVLVNCLCPGFIRTGRMEEVVTAQAENLKISFEERLAQLQAGIPVGRLGRPEEFANFAAFLVSEAASFVTGGTFVCDGGQFRGLM